MVVLAIIIIYSGNNSNINNNISNYDNNTNYDIVKDIYYYILLLYYLGGNRNMSNSSNDSNNSSGIQSNEFILLKNREGEEEVLNIYREVDNEKIATIYLDRNSFDDFFEDNMVKIYDNLEQSGLNYNVFKDSVLRSILEQMWKDEYQDLTNPDNLIEYFYESDSVKNIINMTTMFKEYDTRVYENKNFMKFLHERLNKDPFEFNFIDKFLNDISDNLDIDFRDCYNFGILYEILEDLVYEDNRENILEDDLHYVSIVDYGEITGNNSMTRYRDTAKNIYNALKSKNSPRLNEKCAYNLITGQIYYIY